MAELEAPTKRSKVDYSRNVSLVLPVPIKNGSKETSKQINDLIHQIGNHTFEFPPSVSEDKPYLLSLVFKDEQLQNSNLAILKSIQGCIALGKFEDGYHTLKTQCQEGDIYSVISKCIEGKQYISSFLFSRPIEGKIYIKINATNDNSFRELLKIIPNATAYKTHSHLIHETILVASLPLSPEVHKDDSKIPQIIKKYCQTADIPFNKDNVKIIRKQGQKGANQYTSLRVYYTTDTNDHLNKLLKVSLEVQTPKKSIWRSMTSVSEWHRNQANKPIIRNQEPGNSLTENDLEIKVNNLDSKFNLLSSRFDSMESKLDKILNSLGAGTFHNNSPGNTNDFESDDEITVDDD